MVWKAIPYENIIIRKNILLNIWILEYTLYLDKMKNVDLTLYNKCDNSKHRDSGGLWMQYTDYNINITVNCHIVNEIDPYVVTVWIPCGYRVDTVCSSIYDINHLLVITNNRRLQ